MLTDFKRSLRQWNDCKLIIRETAEIPLPLINEKKFGIPLYLINEKSFES